MIDIIEQMIDDIAERMVNLGVREGTRYSYYQGKIDGMREIVDQLQEARV
jgi:DNA-binding ferritin-like protein